MTSYNDVIVPRLVEYIKSVLLKIDEKDSKNRKINILSVKVVDSNLTDLNYYINNGLTYSFDLIFTYNVTEEDGTIGENMQFTIEVPRMYSNLLIIEGRRRISTTVMGTDFEMRVYGNNIVIDNDRSINFKKLKGGSIELNVIIQTDDGQLDFVGDTDTFDKFKDYLKLTDYQQNKLKIKLDTDNIGEYLTYQNVIDLVNLGNDNQYDRIIDKRFITTEDSLISTLRRAKVRQKILRSMRDKFYANGILYPKDIQNAIFRFFKVADESSVDVPTDINPLVYDSLKSKVVIPAYCAYNSTFTDIIDVVNTPENNNVNKLNELNKCVKLIGDTIYIDCYDFVTKEKVEISYLDYLCSKVLANDHYDYEDKEVITADEYHYKYRMRTHTTTDLSDIKYIEPAPDEKLSITTRRIPMINMSDSVRVAMGASMAKQSIEIENAEPRMISSGNDDEDILEASLITRYPYDEGIVTNIVGDMIYIKDPTNNAIYPYQIPTPTSGINNAMTTFEPVVKVGDKLTKNQALIAPHTLRKNSYDLGLNTKVAYMSYLGYTYEDGIIISESYAKRMADYPVIDVAIELRPEDIVSYIKPIGSQVKSLDILVNNKTKLRAKSITKQIYERLDIMKFMDVNYQKNNLIVPNNIKDGMITDCKIYYNDAASSRLNNSETLKVIEAYEDYLQSGLIQYNGNFPDKYKSLRLDKEYTFTNKKISAVIQFKIVYYSPLKKGSKLCNSWGSKGEVSLVLPDDKMPIIESTNQPVEMILNPAAVISRKNPSQLYEVILNQIIDVVKAKVDELMVSDNINEARAFMSKYYGKKIAKMTDEEFSSQYKEKGKYFFVMKVGCYSRLTYDTVMEWAKELNIEEAQYVTDPELGPIENPVIVGDTYMMRLYHSAEFSGKVTSEVIDSAAPYMGDGLYREEGQKIGEMEYWALLSHGAQQFLDVQRTDQVSQQYSFLNELLMAGYTLVDEKGLPLLSEYRDAMKKLPGKL